MAKVSVLNNRDYRIWRKELSAIFLVLVYTKKRQKSTVVSSPSGESAACQQAPKEQKQQKDTNQPL